ncbi:hypothetical protein PTKIN_Ptkin19aG0077600 [Pterospermum kingtungense]
MSTFLIASWLTPTSLFIFLNIMIGTIFLLSRLSPPKTPHHEQFGHDGYYSAPPLQRVPSLLDRVKSIRLSSYKFANQDIVDDDHHLQPDTLDDHPLQRAPSFVERVKSINYAFYKFSPQNPNTDYIQPTEQNHSDPQPLSRAPSLLERVRSIDFTSFYRSDSFKSNQQTEPASATEEADSDTDASTAHGQVRRSKSDHSKVIQRKLSEKMKKSASENSRSKWEDEEQDQEDEEEDEVEKRRPATTRLEKTVSFGDGDDQGVDAKADDFINKFKQQLKLQRLDSLLRYRDMLMGK